MFYIEKQIQYVCMYMHPPHVNDSIPSLLILSNNILTASFYIAIIIKLLLLLHIYDLQLIFLQEVLISYN